MMGPYDGIEQIPSRYLFAMVVARRARVLQGGAQPLVATRSHKAPRIAQIEAMAGLLDYIVVAPEVELGQPGAAGCPSPDARLTANAKP